MKKMLLAVAMTMLALATGAFSGKAVAGVEEKTKWIEFVSKESWGNVGAGMSYNQNSTLTIYDNGEWTSSIVRKGTEGRETLQIDAKGTLSMRQLENLRSILKTTDAINAKSIEKENSGQAGQSREGPYSVAVSLIVIHSKGRTNEIKIPDGTVVPSTIRLDIQNEKKDIRNLFFFLKARIPYLPHERE